MSSSHKKLLIFFSCLISLVSNVYSAAVQEKVLICGICKNVEKAIPNTIRSAKELGAQFLDYRVVIYENNSTDRTKELLKEWANSDPRLIFLSEDIPKKKLASQLQMKVYNRTEVIARARNKVLDIAMQKKYEDFKYVIWADLDFLEPWDVSNIVDTILHPEQEWDAVLANGAYDLFAFRDAEFPIGFELIGERYWKNLNTMREKFTIDASGPWKKVYSAFGGLGIYKKASIKGCRYSGIVTKDLEQLVQKWLDQAQSVKNVCFLNDYQQLLSTTQVVDITDERLSNRKTLPLEVGVRLKNKSGLGKVVWFSCTKKRTLPWTCEHIPLHASMILQGHDKIFINPRLTSNHP